MKCNIEYKDCVVGLSAECEAVLRSLPEWFGIESSLQSYLRDIHVMDTFSAWYKNHLIGFITVNNHFSESAELHVLGVHKQFHGIGIGSSLYNHVERELKRKNIKYVQVKTLSPTVKNPEYLKTLKFYTKHGFTPLEDTSAFWGENTPCLQMIKSI